MPRFYFIRHGESEANLLRVISNRGLRHGLTPLGRTQAAALAQTLASVKLAAVYTSPLLRAAQTAACLAAGAGCALIEAPALREYDCGSLEGRSDAAAWAGYDDLVHAWVQRGEHASRIEGGESFDDLRERFVPFVRALAARYSDPADNVALVSHGGLLRLMLPLVLDNVDAAFALTHPIGHAAAVVAEGGIDRLTCLDWAGVAAYPSRTSVAAPPDGTRA